VANLMRVGLAALLVSACAGQATAQSDPPAHPWSHGTTLNVSMGVARLDGHARPLLGTSIGWEMTPALAIEGSGYWVDRSGQRGDFAAAMKLHAALPITRPVVPFAVAGFGLYRASFDPAGTGIPQFYRNRMVANGMGTGPLNVFTDPAWIAGGGLDVFVSRHVSVRPDVEVTFVRRNGGTYVVPIGALHVAYHFEDHPITPSRRP
jgi:hypothetical protein